MRRSTANAGLAGPRAKDFRSHIDCEAAEGRTCRRLSLMTRLLRSLTVPQHEHCQQLLSCERHPIRLRAGHRLDGSDLYISRRHGCFRVRISGLRSLRRTSSDVMMASSNLGVWIGELGRSRGIAGCTIAVRVSRCFHTIVGWFDAGW